MSLLIVNMTTCITPFDQWDTFNDVTHQNIPRNRTSVVAEILCVAGSMGGECSLPSKVRCRGREREPRDETPSDCTDIYILYKG